MVRVSAVNTGITAIHGRLKRSCLKEDTMTRKLTLLLLSGWLAAAVLALASAANARSQGAFPEGAFVEGQDGTRWVVAGGVRYRMAFVPDDAGILPGLPEGAVVASIAEFNSALAGAGTRPAAAAPAAPANPAETLVGQRVTACNYSVDFDIEVARVEWTKTVIGNDAPGNAMWIVAFINVTNLSTKAEALTTRPLKVQDGRGREFNVKEYPPDPVDLHRAYGVRAAFQSFDPGITEQTVVTFQVPGDVGSLTLVGKRDFC